MRAGIVPKILGVDGVDGVDDATLFADAYTLDPGAPLSEDTPVSAQPLSTAEFAFAPYVIDGSKWGSQASGTAGGVVTWSLMAAGTAIETTLHNELVLDGIPQTTINALSSFLYSSFETDLRAAFAAWTAVANITFIEVADGGGQAGAGTFADIRVGGLSMDGFSGTLAFTFFPDTVANGGAAGDMYFDTGDASFFDSHSFFLVAAHEIGHAIGLDHSFDANALMYPIYNGALSGLASDDISGARAIYGTAPAPGTAVTYSVPIGQTTLTILNGVANLTVNANSSGDSITGSSFAEAINGGIGNDTLNGGGGDDTLNGAAGIDSMIGGLGNDTYIVDNASDVIVENSGEGTDTVQSSIDFTLSANVENLTLTGYALHGTGNALANVITDLVGADDTLDGGAGADTLIGGYGNDTYIVDNASDMVVEGANQGIDTVLSSVSYSLSTDVENLTLTGSANINATGNALSNVLTGNSGANVLTGGAGSDTYVVDNVGDVVVENANEGTDLVQSSISYTLGSNVENLTLTGSSAINGTGNAANNAITGNTANNTIDAGVGNDTLDGGAGADTLIGGTGDDTYVVDNVGDVVTENSSDGTDTVKSSINYTLGADVENLSLVHASVVGTGNALDNRLEAFYSFDTLVGGGGNDTYVTYTASSDAVIVENSGEGIDTLESHWVIATLPDNVENLTMVISALTEVDATGNALDNVITGGNAFNVIDGGTGADTMVGGSYSNIYVVDNTGDVINSAGSYNAVWSSINYTLASGFNDLRLTAAGLTGTGNSLNNSLRASANNDTLSGGTGNDTYVIDSGVTGTTLVENASEGTDTVQSAASYALASNFENLTLTAAGLTGTGTSGANVLTANGSNDTLIGGMGDDTYVISQNVTATTISENSGEGTDTVQTWVSYALAANVENLTLMLGQIDGTGNALNNIITGDGSDNILDGAAGADTLIGGGGIDTYVVDNTGDTIVDAGFLSTVQSSISYTLGGTLKNLVLTGSSALNGTGNAQANSITGNSAANTLDGGTGADTMSGGAGNDTYIVDNSSDTIVENLGEGTDSVLSSATYVLGNNIENLTLTGSAAINGNGSSLANVITGNSAANVLFGLGGNDTLDGGAGADTLRGGTGDDTYIVNDNSDFLFEFSGEGTDTVISSVNYALFLDFENLTLTGSAVTGTGNGLDNVITGNAANNALIGNAGNDTLDGGAGNDTLTGGAGNDVYYVDSDTDVVSEAAGQGNDTVYTSHFYFLPGNVETLIMTGTDDLWAVGNGIAHTMYGNSGNNSLSAGTGVATLYGGAGDDIYYLNKVTDVAIENPGEGFDTIFTSFSMTAPTNFEAVALLAGAGNLSLTGGAANTMVFLYGNSGDNTLTSGGGQTILIGQFGDDVAYVNHNDDQVVEAPNQGFDTIYSSISYTLSDYVEAIHLTGTGDLYAIGNATPSFLYGNSGNNSLIAGSGVATMAGGLGDDMYTVNNGLDVVVENANEGFDTVFSSVSYTLLANVDALVLNGTGNTFATGNGSTNFLYGNSGNNTLDGAGGNDVLTGNGGADRFVFGVGGGNDIVTDFSHAQGDQIDVTAFQTTFGALAIATVGSDAVITLAGQTITLQGVTPASLVAADFMF